MEVAYNYIQSNKSNNTVVLYTGNNNIILRSTFSVVRCMPVYNSYPTYKCKHVYVGGSQMNGMNNNDYNVVVYSHSGLWHARGEMRWRKNTGTVVGE